MIVKLLTEHHLEPLSLTGGCTDASESTLVKMPHYWKSHALAQIFIPIIFSQVGSNTKPVWAYQQGILLYLQYYNRCL